MNRESRIDGLHGDTHQSKTRREESEAQYSAQSDGQLQR